MNVPVEEDPLGALVGEVLFVAPIKNGYGFDDDAVAGNLKVEFWENTTRGGEAAWKMMVGPVTPGTGSPEYVFHGGYDPRGYREASLHFSKPVRVESVSWNNPWSYANPFEIYGVNRESETLLVRGTSAKASDGTKSWRVTDKGFYEKLKFVFDPAQISNHGIQNFVMVAYFKP